MNGNEARDEARDETRIAGLPCWHGTVTSSVLSGGLSNRNWLVTDDAGRHVVRFGADYPFHHVDRTREAVVARAAQAAGFGPAVEYAGPGVLVTAYLDARTLVAADLCADPARIGHLLRRFHHGMAAGLSGPGFIFWPFHVIRDYARTLALAPGADEQGAGDLPGWVAVSDALEAVQVPLPIIFGHHDLLPANILATATTAGAGQDGDRLWLIDYEYAGFGTAMFDLAGAASNAGMAQAEAEMMLSAYLGHAPGPGFLRAFDAMQCESLLREMLWARVSARHLFTPGVDFFGYAAENRDRLAVALDAYQSVHGKLCS